jgi:hypothetical protein
MQCQICLRLHSGGWTLISKPTGTTAVEASTNMLGCEGGMEDTTILY